MAKRLRIIFFILFILVLNLYTFVKLGKTFLRSDSKKSAQSGAFKIYFKAFRIDSEFLKQYRNLNRYCHTIHYQNQFLV